MQRSAATKQPKQPGQMGAWAPYYDLIMKVLTLGREHALRQLEVDLSTAKPGDHVLEVGCGTGTLTLALARRVGLAGTVDGVDIAPEMVRVARRKHRSAASPATFTVAPIDTMPFPDKAFDVAVCSFMIFHMPDEVRQRGLRELARVLRPGASLLVVDAAKADLDGLGRDLAQAGFVVAECCTRAVARLAPSVRYLRATAREDRHQG